MPRGRARAMWLWVALANLPPLLAIALLTSATGAVALALPVLMALAYSVPPVRTKVVPGLDSVTSSLHFVLPCVCGGLLGGAALGELPWRFLAAFFPWGWRHMRSARSGRSPTTGRPASAPSPSRWARGSATRRSSEVTNPRSRPRAVIASFASSKPRSRATSVNGAPCGRGWWMEASVRSEAAGDPSSRSAAHAASRWRSLSRRSSPSVAISCWKSSSYSASVVGSASGGVDGWPPRGAGARAPQPVLDVLRVASGGLAVQRLQGERRDRPHRLLVLRVADDGAHVPARVHEEPEQLAMLRGLEVIGVRRSASRANSRGSRASRRSISRSTSASRWAYSCCRTGSESPSSIGRAAATAALWPSTVDRFWHPTLRRNMCSTSGTASAASSRKASPPARRLRRSRRPGPSAGRTGRRGGSGPRRAPSRTWPRRSHPALDEGDDVRVALDHDELARAREVRLDRLEVAQDLALAVDGRLGRVQVLGALLARDGTTAHKRRIPANGFIASVAGWLRPAAA